MQTSVRTVVISSLAALTCAIAPLRAEARVLQTRDSFAPAAAPGEDPAEMGQDADQLAEPPDSEPGEDGEAPATDESPDAPEDAAERPDDEAEPDEAAEEEPEEETEEAEPEAAAPESTSFDDDFSLDANEEPLTGKGLLIAGGTILGVSTAGMIVGALLTRGCSVDGPLQCRYQRQDELFIPLAASGMVAGLLVLGVGLVYRHKHKRWEKDQKQAHGMFTPSFVRGGAGVGYVGRF